MSRAMDVIVVGLGAVGSAAAWRLAASGHHVIGFDTWAPPHAEGSTHAESRITRETAWEGAEYVPLVQRANALWRELERDSGETLFVQKGGVFLGRPTDEIVAASRASADATRLPYELLDAAELRKRWPHLAPEEWMVGFVDPGAGILYPEAIVRAAHTRARALGAKLRVNEHVTAWRADGDGVRVTTAQREYRADRLILCTGAWMPEVLAPLGVELKVERITLHWFAARDDAPSMDVDHAPIHLVCPDGILATAIFPAMNGAIKATGHGGGVFTTPETMDRTVHPSDVAPVDAIVRRYVPRNAGALLRSATCMYTMAPHGQFILDRHPEHSQVVLGSPCTGFGFKFSSATGEMLADLATGTAPRVDATPWRLPG